MTHRAPPADSANRNEAEACLAAVMEWSQDAIVGVSLDGEITSFSRGAEALYQASASEMIGRQVCDFAPDELAMQEREARAAVARDGAVVHMSTQRRRKDGARLDVELTIVPLRNGDGAICGLTTIARDRIALRAGEVARRSVEYPTLRPRSSHAALRSATVVAHDFNNLLSVILGYTDLILGDLAPDETLLTADLKEVRVAAQRARELTREIVPAVSGASSRAPSPTLSPPASLAH